jgi:hypothetical protein
LGWQKDRTQTEEDHAKGADWAARIKSLVVSHTLSELSDIVLTKSHGSVGILLFQITIQKKLRENT